MSLSDKIIFGIPTINGMTEGVIATEDVKEAVKELKKDIPKDHTAKEFRKRVDKIFGDKLIWANSHHNKKIYF